MRFVNREAELKVLSEALSAPSPALFVLYGRRRVGKTALLRQACRGFRHVFFTADLGSRSDQLSSFSACLAQGLDEPAWAEAVMPGWEEALRLCCNQAQSQPLVLVLDRIGAWWRGPQEVDVAAVADDGPLLLGECKWTSRPLGVGVLHSLQEKAPLVSADLERPASQIHFALFSPSGFTPKLQQEAGKKQVLLCQVGDLFSGRRSK